MSVNQSLVNKWMESVGLSQTTPYAQISVMSREVDELVDAFAAYMDSPQSSVELRAKVLDELGDVIITTFTTAEALGANWQEVFHNAYQKINARTGTVEGGIFIKSEDLEEPGKL